MILHNRSHASVQDISAHIGLDTFLVCLVKPLSFISFVVFLLFNFRVLSIQIWKLVFKTKLTLVCRIIFRVVFNLKSRPYLQSSKQRCRELRISKKLSYKFLLLGGIKIPYLKANTYVGTRVATYVAVHKSLLTQWRHI